jgi:hypothetical protein
MHQQNIFAAGGTLQSSAGATAPKAAQHSASLVQPQNTISNGHLIPLEIAVTYTKQTPEAFSNRH